MTDLTDRASAPDRRVAGILALVFSSGAAGLAYEISWARQLGLAFGHTARAAAVVLAAYFLGMALGYAWASRASERWRQPLLGYAAVEAVVGLWALVVPVLAGLLPHASLPVGDGGDGIRAIYSLVLLLPGTTALGASLPFVARAVAGLNPARAGERIARVYAFNLLGAVAGVAVTTFGLLATLGVVATSYAAAGLSLGVAVVAACGRRTVSRPLNREPGPEIPVPDRRLWTLAAAISGFGALAAQVLYTRLFSLIFHNSTYTFAAILFVILLALAAGSALVSAAIGRIDLRLGLVRASMLAAVGLPVSAWALVELRGLAYFRAGHSFEGYVLGAVGLVTAVCGLPCLAMGVILPSCWELAGAARKPGRVVGEMTMANTLAAAIGALCTSFVLVPLLDLWWSFAVVAATYLGLAALVMRQAGRLRRAGWWILAAGTVVVSTTVHVDRVRGLRHGEELIRRFHGPYGWIQVTRGKHHAQMSLSQNTHYGLGSIESSPMELRQGHTPLLLHNDPKQVAFIGLATGITASAALDHPGVERVTVVELIDDVVEAAAYFSAANADILHDPRTTVLVGDGRHVLSRLPRRFDVIVSDLFVPWESQTGYLYTVEHFEAMRGRLNEDGLFCVWLAGWQVGPEEFETIANSMRAVFDLVGVFVSSRNARRPLLALVGTTRPRHLSRTRIEDGLRARRPPAMGRDRVLRRAEDLANTYLGDWPWRPEGPFNTDERPRIEFFSPRTHRTPGGRLKRANYERYRQTELASLPREAFRFDAPGS
ncbi:MAG: hypothetical protein B7733_02425 [Myxococcales bacterium FL481]|nr:MAG: hypothetical protein B7733_02425 [Myxococcales bacterium FL481]